MKFEEALQAMRVGAKIHHPHMPDDEYYMACRVAFHPSISEPININDMAMSILWMKAGKEHPEFRPKWNMHDPKTDPCKHGMSPMINLLWLMSEGWEIVE